MKQRFRASLLFVFISVTVFAFIPKKHRLPGKWTVYNSDGTSSGEYVEFRNDGTYSVYLLGGQIGEAGYYKLKRHVFYIKNAVARACGENYWGRYKLDFHGDDSIHFMLIEDTCANRRYDIVGLNPGLRRIITQ